MERLGSQLVNPPLRSLMHLDESSIAEHSEVFGNLRLVEPEPVNNLSYRAGSVTQQLDNFESVAVGQRGKRLYH